MHKIQELAIEVRRLAVENPGTNYYARKNCSYFTGGCSDGTIGCIVGQAARNIGYDEFLNAAKIEEDKDFSDTTADNILSKMLDVEQFTGDIAFIRYIQAHQDHGSNWGECLLMTEKIIKI